MCSISWQINAEGYDLFFTRDEQRSRPPAEAPRINEAVEGASYLAPTDPQGGGTWIFVNEHGLTGALLKAYELIGRTPDGGGTAQSGPLAGFACRSDNGRNIRQRPGGAHHP